MRDLEAVKDLARQRLEKTTGRAQLSRSFWDRAVRMAANSQFICNIPEIKCQNFQIDHFCLLSAAYFSQCGFAAYIHANKSIVAFCPENNSDVLTDLCTREIEQTLEGFLVSTQIQKICEILIETSSRFTNRLEAMILSDAKNLEEIGAIGLYHELRHCMQSGKNITDILAVWKRKVDYRYWEARIKEGFRFESVRNIAQSRLEATGAFMEQLRIEVESSDLNELFSEDTQEKSPAGLPFLC